jgi:hypothetical protein
MNLRDFNAFSAGDVGGSIAGIVLRGELRAGMFGVDEDGACDVSSHSNSANNLQNEF